jgi:Flp pilus assembly protein TadG
MARARRRCGRDDERGVVMVVTVIGMTVLLIFVALAVDFGSFYVRAAQIKRAADAAALAGVVWMPEFETAEQVALATAKRNGFEDGVDDIRVTAARVTGKNRQLRVTITDDRVDQYFSRVVVERQGITRGSTAEYVLPVPLGSPKNTFGTGDLLSGSNRENFWAAVNGFCAGHESGDDKLARYESYSSSSGSTQCNTTSPASPQADEYDPNGYLYAIELPENATSLKLEIYDAAYNTSGSPSDLAVAGGSQQVTTIFEVYDRNPTPLDLSNLSLLSTTTLTTNQSQGTYQNRWANFRTWNNPQAGIYYVRVKTQANQLNSRASNGFALRAFTGSTFGTNPCTTIIGATGYSASCPNVYGVNDMSLLANFGGTNADFFLADVDPVHAGKTMRLRLFDPGEGANSLQILDPNGSPASFAWSTPCSPPTPPAGGCSGSGSSLNVSGTGAQPFSPMASSSRYNDRSIIIDVPLPANYTAVFGTKTWWKIRYAVGTSPTDRTTWAANIVGDPVHLTD